MTLAFQLAGIDHSNSVTAKVQQLNSDSDITRSFRGRLSEELTKRSMIVNVAVLGSTVLDANQVSGAGGSSGGPGPSPVSLPAPSAASAGAVGVHATADDSSNLGVIVVIVIAVALVALCGIALCAVCIQKTFQQQQQISPVTEQVAVAPRLVSRAAMVADPRSARHSSRERQGKSFVRQDSVRSSRVSSSSQNTPRSMDPGVSEEGVSTPGKLAWPCITDERQATPDSGSTATGGDSHGSASASTALAMGSARTSQSNQSSRRPASHISAAPQQPQPAADWTNWGSEQLPTQEAGGGAATSSGTSPRFLSVKESDKMEVESLNSAAAPATPGSSASPLRLAGLREAQQPPVPAPKARTSVQNRSSIQNQGQAQSRTSMQPQMQARTAPQIALAAQQRASAAAQQQRPAPAPKAQLQSRTSLQQSRGRNSADNRSRSAGSRSNPEFLS